MLQKPGRNLERGNRATSPKSPAAQVMSNEASPQTDEMYVVSAGRGA
jgi:hypothetical protein